MKINLSIEAENTEDVSLLVRMLSSVSKPFPSGGDIPPVVDVKVSTPEPVVKPKTVKPEVKQEEKEIEEAKENPEPISIHVDTPDEAAKVVELSLDTLRTNTATAIEKGFKTEVKDKLKEFKAANVAQLKPNQYEAWNNFVISLAETK